MITEKIPVGQIEMNEDRTEGGKGDIESLARNMEKYGQINAITVVKDDVKKIYRIIAGRRRVTAALSLGWADIRADVYGSNEITEDSEEMIALSENASREEMNAIDEGVLYANELKKGTPVAELAALFCRSKSAVYQRAKLASLVPEMRQFYKDGLISLHVAAMAATLPEEVQKKVAEDNSDGCQIYEWKIRNAISHAHNDYLSWLCDCADCANCQKRTRFSDGSLFPELSDNDDRCLDHDCFTKKWAEVISRAYDDFFVEKSKNPAEWEVMNKNRIVSSVSFPEGLKIGDIEVARIDRENGETDISDEDLELQNALGKAGKTDIVPCWDGDKFSLAVLANENDIDEMMGKNSGQKSEYERKRREHLSEMLGCIPESERSEIMEDYSKAYDIEHKAEKKFHKALRESATADDGDGLSGLRLAVCLCKGFYKSTKEIKALIPEAGITDKDDEVTVIKKLASLSFERLASALLLVVLDNYSMQPTMYGIEGSQVVKIYRLFGLDVAAMRDAAVMEVVNGSDGEDAQEESGTSSETEPAEDGGDDEEESEEWSDDGIIYEGESATGGQDPWNEVEDAD